MNTAEIITAALASVARVEALRAASVMAAAREDTALRLSEAASAAAALADSAPADFVAALTAFARHVGLYGEPAELFRACVADLDNTGEPGPVRIVADATILSTLCLVALRRDYAARQDAAAARTTIGTLAEPVIETAGTLLGEAAFAHLSDLVGQSVRNLSRIAADRAPLVRVETGVSLPSTVLAWRLYQDPARAAELVERNRVTTPAFMPVSIEAVAPE
ncbi:hypothetical protein [Afifella sp. YEN Y35]|uniref:hypothetical protein n=1 Tax=Afifella sp. YEN Y35 TaxID=3388337 RepID=UPI0039E0643A